MKQRSLHAVLARPHEAPVQRIGRRRITFALLASALLVALLVGYMFAEPYWLKVTRMDFADPDVPPPFDGTRVVFISDIHHGSHFSTERVARLVEKVNALNPDIILLGGDYVHQDPKYIFPCFEELARLRATMGKFGVAGNHDHWESIELTREAMARAGIVALDNRAVWIERGSQRIRIGGVGDLWEDAADADPTIGDAGQDDFVILLSHNPDYAERIAHHKIDLVLSGHTHGGQVTFFGLWAAAVPSAYGQKYRSGMVDTGYTKVLTSNGVGTITPPVRFFARPEIVVLTLKRE